MPLGGPPLPQATIDVDQPMDHAGCAASSCSPSVRPSSLPWKVTVPSAEGMLLQVAPERLVVGFDKQLDASLVNYTTITLQRRVSDDLFEDLPTGAALNPGQFSGDPDQRHARRW